MIAPSVYVSLDDTLKLLRAELKREFPGTKFSIRRSRGTGYGYVHVGWTDGPTDAEVSAITRGYEGEGFDGMTDCRYSIEHVGADAKGSPVRIHHGTRGILTSRKLSAALVNTLIARVVSYWGGVENPPVAVEGSWGYTLRPEVGHLNIRADVALDWHAAIHRAAGGSYIRERA